MPKRPRKPKRPQRRPRAAAGPLWSEWLDRSSPWPTDEAGYSALRAFESAALKLFTQGREHEDFTRADELAISLVAALGPVFLHRLDSSFADTLQATLDAFQASSQVRTRAWTVRDVTEFAPRWQQAGAASRDRLLTELVRRLCMRDAAFAKLSKAKLAKKLENFDPRPSGKRAAVGPETIVASLVHELGGALGYKLAPGDEVEDVRRRLARDVAKYFSRAR